jgi:mannose-6-phosphate isomerase-like protein (cupin superfamily)
MSLSRAAASVTRQAGQPLDRAGDRPNTSGCLGAGARAARSSGIAGIRRRPRRRRKGEYRRRAIAHIICRMEDAMQADLRVELRDRLIALGADKRATSITLNERATCAADWVAGTFVAADDRAVHADCWERHPAGDEALFLLEGCLAITLASEDGSETQATLQVGEAFIVRRGTWHRLHVLQPGRLLVITPPAGTEHRRHETRQQTPSITVSTIIPG